MAPLAREAGDLVGVTLPSREPLSSKAPMGKTILIAIEAFSGRTGSPGKRGGR